MKFVLIFTSLFAVPAFAKLPFIDCNHIQLVGPESTEEKVVLRPSGISVSVTTNEKQDFFFAVVTQNKTEITSTADVQGGTFPAADGDALALAKLVVPGFKAENVKGMRVANVFAKQNMQDGGGIKIMVLLDAAGRPLAQVAQVGWGFGVCSK